MLLVQRALTVAGHLHRYPHQTQTKETTCWSALRLRHPLWSPTKSDALTTVEKISGTRRRTIMSVAIAIARNRFTAIIVRKILRPPGTSWTMSADELVISDSPIHPANLICELCRLFYGSYSLYEANSKAMGGLQGPEVE